MLPQSFYNQKTLKVAQDLLGCFLIRKIGNKTIRAKIIETEGYNGPRDKASHASRGMTERKNGLWIEEREEKIKSTQIKKTPRIGIDYAEEYKDKLWRYLIT